MKYDFDEKIERLSTGSVKWGKTPDGAVMDESYLSMWIADMDFGCAKPITDAIKKAADDRIFGYTELTDKYFEAVESYYSRRHGLEMKRENIVFTQGVVPALGHVVRALTKPGDKIIVQPPVYPPFSSSVSDNCRVLVENPLIADDGYYTMDFVDLEKKAAMPGVKMLILCNPHNPVGRVWTKDELCRLHEICKKNDLIILSDEIHCDLVRSEKKHLPIATLFPSDDNIVTCTAPTKTFNIAGLAASHALAINPDYRKKIVDEVGHLLVNPLSSAAVMAAFNDGEEWLGQLLQYIDGNMDFFKSYTQRMLPKSRFCVPEGTYLAWFDVSRYCEDTRLLEKELVKKEHLYVEAGDGFGHGGKGFLRINMACPRAVIKDAVDRMASYFGSADTSSC
ncbi:MAG: MalY/PatB family protein [Oscillospiraceae bacterium]